LSPRNPPRRWQLDKIARRANVGRAFLRMGLFAYAVLGVRVALVARLGAITAVRRCGPAQESGDALSLVVTIDRVLLVLIEILAWAWPGVEQSGRASK
jgi:hypothetical protein